MHDGISSLVEYLTTTAWAMEPGVLDKLAMIVKRHVDGVRLTETEISAATGGKSDLNTDGSRAMVVEDGLAIISISGVIARHSSLVNGSSQPKGTGLNSIRNNLQAAMANDEVAAIFLYVDSPGGAGTGLPDLADEIRAADKIKPVYAFTENQAASAAYWLASQARQVWSTRDAATGSIGVYAVIVDESRAAKNQGFDVSVVRTGPLKGAYVPGSPVGEAFIGHVQEEVSAMFADFQEAVSRGRGLTGDALAAVSDGRSFRGTNAMALGLIDGIKTLPQAIEAARTAVGLAGESKDNNKRPAAGSSKRGSVGGNAEDSKLQGENMNKSTKTPAGEAEVNESAAGEQTTINLAEETAKILKAERQRTADINAAMPGEAFAEIREKAIADGIDVPAAKALGFEAANERVAALTSELATLKAAVGKAGVPLPSLAGKASDAEGPDEEAERAKAAGTNTQATMAAKYEARVDQLVAGGKTRGMAFNAATKEMPDEHEAWIAANQPVAGSQ